MSWGEVWTETGTDVGWIHAELASNQVDGSGGSGCVGRVGISVCLDLCLFSTIFW